jgi:hypothetical protein
MASLPEIRKEVQATMLFAAAGLAGLIIAPRDWPAVAATGLFYVALLINTYYSICFFGLLPPKDRDERVIDGALVVTYLALGLSIGRIVLFTSATTALFVIAIAKYVLLVPIVARRDILRRKIAIDGLGLLLCGLSFAGALAGHPLESAWLQAILFGVANVYLLLVRPMYVD